MINRIYESPECWNIYWTNSVGASGTGAAAAIAAGDVVYVGGKAFVAFGAIATSASGTLVGSGTFTLGAVSGDTWSQGARLGYNFTTKKIDPLGPALFEAASAKTNGQTTAEATILLQAQSQLVVNRVVSAGEDTANTLTYTHTRGLLPTACIVSLRNSSGVQRPCTVTQTVDTIVVAEASLAATDKLEILAIWT